MTLQAGVALVAGVVIAGLIAYGVRQYMRDDPWDEIDDLTRDDEDPKA